MKAVKYKVKITTDLAHGWTNIIDEIFIPESEVVINKEGYAFQSDEQRGHIDEEEIEIDDDVVLFLTKYVESYEELKKVAEELFKT